MVVSRRKVTLVPVDFARLHLADGVDAGLGNAALEALAPDLALAPHLHLQPLGQGVDGRDADAVQAAGDLVAAAAELAARVQLGHHHRQAPTGRSARGCPRECRGRCR